MPISFSSDCLKLAHPLLFGFESGYLLLQDDASLAQVDFACFELCCSGVILCAFNLLKRANTSLRGF